MLKLTDFCKINLKLHLSSSLIHCGVDELLAVVQVRAASTI